ncbi:MAG: cell wall-binding repeat-containing protein, partial [Actinomycetes bacterium]
DATFTADSFGGRDTQHTVFLSEDDADYPWQSTNYDNTAGVTDTETTFAADGRSVLFTRTTASTQTIEEIAVLGEDPPFDLPQPAGANSQPAASANGDIAFVNVAATGPNAGVPWVWFLAQGSSTPVALQAGTHPKFSPDGSLIAFFSGTGSLSTMTTAGGSVALAGPTSFPGTVKDYTWSPDGTKFLFGLAVGAGAVDTAPVTAGSVLSSVAVTSCLTRANQVAWQPIPTTPDQVVRVWGSTRENTSVAVSKAGFGSPGTADAVVLADSYHFPDALSGAPLAGFVHGPLLLTPGSQTAVLPAIKAEMSRVLGSTSKPIYILGGTGSVSAGIQADLVTAGYTNITRLAGINRYETSLAIANFMGHDATAPQELLLATGTDFPDGLSAGAAAASYWPSGGGGAVLLTNGGTLLPDTKAYIDSAIANEDPNNKVYVTTVGGLAEKAYPLSLHPDVITCTGADRYETSACVAEVHFGAQPSAAIATGTSFPDALSGGAFAGAINAPLLLAPASLTTFNESPYFLHAASGAISTAYVFGGTGVVNSTQLGQLQSIIGLNTLYNQITPSSVLSAASRAVAKAKAAAKQAPYVKGQPRQLRRGSAG